MLSGLDNLEHLWVGQLALAPVMGSLPSSAIPRTLGRGTAYLAARSFLLSLMADDNALASWGSAMVFTPRMDIPSDPLDPADM